MQKHGNDHEAIVWAVQSDLSSADELNSAFRSRFSERESVGKCYAAHWLETPLGAMVAIADDEALCMLEFYDRVRLDREITALFARERCHIAPGKTKPLALLEQELKRYFAGTLKEFTTPLRQQGTPFQIASWNALQNIPYGETRSYQEQAALIGQDKAHRAVANANSRNKIALVVPCHRVIKSDGDIGGYGGRVERKRFLLSLERKSL